MERKALLKAIDTNRGDVYVQIFAIAGSDSMTVKVNRQNLFDTVKQMGEGETGYRLIVEAGRNYFLPEIDYEFEPLEDRTTDAEIEAKVDLSQAPAEEAAPKDPIRDVPYAGNFDYAKREFKAA